MQNVMFVDMLPSLNRNRPKVGKKIQNTLRYIDMGCASSILVHVKQLPYETHEALT